MRFAPTKITLALAATLCAGSALASGYHFGSQSASSQGTANANGAEAADASVLFYNPAGMTRLDGTQASGVLNVVLPKGEFTDTGTVTAAGTPVPGTGSGKFVKPTPVPHLYMTHKYSNSVSTGLAFFVPFASKSEYDSNWTGRYNTIGTELVTMALNPSVAFKPNETISLGAGFTLQHIDGKLSKAADFGTGAIGAVTSAVAAINPAAAAAIPGVLVRAGLPGNPAYSGRVDVEGKDWGMGFNFGAMFELDKDTRFGVAYRSRIRHSLEGTADWTVADGTANLRTAITSALTPVVGAATAGALGAGTAARLAGLYVDSDAKLNVDTPESLSVNFYKGMGNIAFMGDITRTRHSRFQELRIDFASALPDSVTPQKWVDTTRYSLGMNYKYSDALMLRGGFAFDGSPVSDANRTPSIPDGDRRWLSAGLNYKLSANSSIDVALSYIDVATGPVNNFDNGGQVNPATGAPVCNQAANTSSCATIKGNYKLSSGLIGMQYNHRF